MLHTEKTFLAHCSPGSHARGKSRPLSRRSMRNKNLLFVQYEMTDSTTITILSAICNSEQKLALCVKTKYNVNVSNLGVLSPKLGLKLHSCPKEISSPTPPRPRITCDVSTDEYKVRRYTRAPHCWRLTERWGSEHHTPPHRAGFWLQATETVLSQVGNKGGSSLLRKPRLDAKIPSSLPTAHHWPPW